MKKKSSRRKFIKKFILLLFGEKFTLEYEKDEEEEEEEEVGVEILRVIISNIHLLAYVSMFLR